MKSNIKIEAINVKP